MDKDKEQFADQDTLTIEPLGSDMKFRGNYSMFTGSDGNLYGRLDLDRYMIQFESERFMTFEISSEETQGLKIPVSSVMEKEFYTIPVDYMTTGGNATEDEAGSIKKFTAKAERRRLNLSRRRFIARPMSIIMSRRATMGC